jgi:hypothetical protein
MPATHRLTADDRDDALPWRVLRSRPEGAR